jgi:O-succinylbenzoate synthase
LDVRAAERVEYIEEPVKQTKRKKLKKMQRLSHWRNLRIALDETLLDIDHRLFQEYALDPSFQLVLKPSLFSLLETAQYYRAEYGVTISCSFETGLGLAFLACLAAASPLNEQTHGLCAHAVMAKNHPLTAEYHALVSNGRVDVRGCEDLLSRFAEL